LEGTERNGGGSTIGDVCEDRLNENERVLESRMEGIEREKERVGEGLEKP